VRHEETAAFAAGAEAHLTSRLAVCAGSCGPGNLHLINGLYDCHRSRVPVLAIAAADSQPRDRSGYFQETSPSISSPSAATTVSSCRSRADCRGYWKSPCKRRSPGAVSRGGAAGDVALREAVGSGRDCTSRAAASVCPAEDELVALALLLDQAKKITILGGAGCAGAHEELIELAGKLKAPIVHAMRARSSSSTTTRLTSA